MGKPTRWTIAAGIALFCVLALLPIDKLFALYALIITPIAATFVTSIELFLGGHRKESLSLIAALGLIAIAFFWRIG